MEKTIIDESWTDEEILEFINENEGKVSNITITRRIYLEAKEIKDSYLSFNDCTCSAEIILVDNNDPFFIFSISNSELEKITIYDSTFSNLEIKSSYIKNLTLLNVILLYESTIELNDFRENLLQFYDVKGSMNILLSETYSGNIKCDSKELEIHCESKSKLANLYIEKIDIGTLYGNFGLLNIGNYQELEISCLIFDDENKSKYDLINKISIQSKNSKGSLLLEDLSINELEFFYFLNANGIVSFQNLKVQNGKISQSILGNIHWNNIVFKEELNIDNSDISKISYSNIKWIQKTYFTLFDDELYLKNYLTNDDKSEVNKYLEELRDNRETYRQLKLVAQNMKNKHDELEFARLENRLLWKEARVSKSMNWQDRFIIFTNRWSADFGQSWAMPLGWLMVIHLILFMCLFNWQFSCNLEHFENGIGVYLKLLNPVHQSPEFISTGMGHITEFCMRISSGFFIYHFLRATRKYVQS